MNSTPNENGQSEGLRRKKVREHLKNLVGPGAAAFFSDACKMLDKHHEFEAATHSIGNYFRELNDSVLAVVFPLTGKKIPTDGNANAAFKIHACIEYLGLDSDSEVARFWIDITDGRSGSQKGFHSYAHRNNLFPARSLSAEDKKRFQRFESLLFIVLQKLENKFFDFHKRIDTLLESESSESATVKRLKSEIPQNPRILDYFFQRIVGSAWLQPLASNGFFDHPLPLIRIRESESEYVSPQVWPQSRFLLRMAKISPVEVAAIAAAIPSTDNFCIESDLVDIGTALPAGYYPTICKRIESYVISNDWLPYGWHYVDLIKHLAGGKQSTHAIDLLSHLLRLNDSGPEPISPNYPESRAKKMIRVRKNTYNELLVNTRELLLHDTPWEYFDRLIDLFSDALEKTKTVSQTSNESLYYRGPHAIENHENNKHDLSPLDYFVYVLRDAAVALVKADARKVLDRIESQNKDVFIRIGLYLRGLEPWPDIQRTAEMLGNEILLDNGELHHERYLLLERAFLHLPDEAQAKYIEYAQTSFDARAFRESEKKWTGKQPSDEDVAVGMRRHTYRKLYPVRKFLKSEIGRRFIALREEFGDLAHPDFIRYSQGGLWRRLPSSTSLDRVRTLSMEELIEELNLIASVQDSFGDSVDEAGEVLESLTMEDPEKVLTNIELFRGSQPAYLDGILRGIARTIQNGDSVESYWVQILSVCLWILAQDRDEAVRSGKFADVDPGWGWTRRAIASLLEQALSRDTSGLSFLLREEVWEILSVLVEDPDPSTNDGDIESDALVSVRGRAFRALIDYTCWVRRNLKDSNRGLGNGGKLSFQEIPEARAVLEYHLDIEVDDSYAVRSIYGRYFARLATIDLDWAADHIDSIFPINDRLTDYRRAAWDAYVCDSRVYWNIFGKLKDRYITAIQELKTRDDYGAEIFDPDVGLAGHLMVAYMDGMIEFDSDDGLLSNFYSSACDGLRAEASKILAEIVSACAEEKRSAYSTRAQEFWENRIGIAVGDAESHRTELKSFGKWFKLDFFDAKWALDQLQQVLELVHWITSSYSVVKRLLVLCTEYPMECTTCLNLMLEGPPQTWSLSDISTDAKQILTNVYECGGVDEREAARAVINRFGAAGFAGFQGILTAESALK